MNPEALQCRLPLICIHAQSSGFTCIYIYIYADANGNLNVNASIDVLINTNTNMNMKAYTNKVLHINAHITFEYKHTNIPTHVYKYIYEYVYELGYTCRQKYQCKHECKCRCKHSSNIGIHIYIYTCFLYVHSGL